MNHPKITRQEWRNVFVLALAIMFLATIPYLIGMARQNDRWRFGWFTFGADDGNSYLAKMREGGIGRWTFQIVYTSEPHDGAFIFVPYLLFGKLAAVIASPTSPTFVDAMLLVFHIARILFGVLLILVIYRFVAVFVIQKNVRWFVIILIMLGGGLGWLLILLGQDNWLGSSPIDLYVPEGYSFYLLYGLPHLSLARAAMFGGLLFIFASLALDAPRQWLPQSILAGVCWLIMGLSVPFYISVIYAIVGVWGLATWLRERNFPWRLLWRCVVAALIPAPYLIYNFAVFSINPILKTWQAQNLLPSPHPLHYVLGYGVFVILALPAFRWAWQRGKHKSAYLLLPAWVLAAPILVYLPIGVQRRLLEGVFVPLVILSAIGLRYFWIKVSSRRRIERRWKRSTILVFALTLPTSFIILMLGIIQLLTQAPGSPLFHNQDENAMLDWLNTNVPANAVVLSDPRIGNYLPARTSLRAFVGHGPETIGFTEKRTMAEAILSGKTDAASTQSLIEKYGIRYLIADTTQIAPLGLKQIYQNASYRVFEIP